MTTLLITGAGGFIGRHLCALALARGMAVRGTVRDTVRDTVRSLAAGAQGVPPAERLQGVRWIACGEVGPATDWSAALRGVDAVVHLAGRAHVPHESSGAAEAALHAVNVQGTLRLADAMQAHGVRRLVYVSSIHVHGGATTGAPFREDSPPRPHNAYARSKWEAEQALRALATPRSTGGTGGTGGTVGSEGIEPVIVRPALVYGPGVKGNLLRLLRWIGRGRPLPLGAIRNARSLIGATNLCDLLLHAATHPRAGGESFVAADEGALSTPQLVRVLARHLERPARLLALPPRAVGAALTLVGQGYAWQQLAASLVVDAGKSRAFFARTDPAATEDGLAEMARWFAQSSA